jgi:hypothetical protein
MASRCGERHRFLLTLLGFLPQISVELAVEGKDAAAGAWTKVDAQLLELGMDAELAQARVAL